MTGQILTLFFLIILSALFSGMETALISMNSIKVTALFKQRKNGAAALQRIKKNPHKLIITLLIANNVINIGAASLATVLFTNLFGDAGVGVATGVMTFLILVFGEITPKTYANLNAEKISLLVARPVEVLSFILSPLVKLFEFISNLLLKLLPSKPGKKLSEQELRTIVTMGKNEGLITKEAAEMMHNVLEFEDTQVQEIMTPKVDMKMLDGSKKLKEVIDFVVKTPFSRYPVFEYNNDKIIGILDVDDVLKYTKNNKLDALVKDVANKVTIVPETKKIDNLLVEFENKKVPTAVVVDEYGEVVGLVTVEDILEEIVGDIFDKSKKKNLYFKKTRKDSMKVDAKTSIEEINKIFHLDLKAGDFTTIGGFIENKLQRIPKKGEKIKIKNLTLIADKVTKQKIITVKIVKS